MKKPEELTAKELADIVGQIQERLFLDLSSYDEGRLSQEEIDAGIAPRSDFWNPHKEWDGADMLDFIASLLDKHGLAPRKPEVAVGTDQEDD